MSIARHHFNSNWDYTCFLITRAYRWCVSLFIPRFIRRWRRPRIPPFGYLTQIGDPVLRVKAMPVPPCEILSKQTAGVIECMIHCLDRYGSVGVTAPQVSVPLRMIVMEYKEEALAYFSEDEILKRQMSIMPLIILINPTIEITSDKVINFPEGCLSLCGYGAIVPRYEKCTLRGLSFIGTETEVHLQGWNARIAQHQMDHLEGTFFMDIMDIETFHSLVWREVNGKGKAKIVFNDAF